MRTKNAVTPPGLSNPPPLNAPPRPAPPQPLAKSNRRKVLLWVGGVLSVVVALSVISATVADTTKTVKKERDTARSELATTESSLATVQARLTTAQSDASALTVQLSDAQEAQERAEHDMRLAQAKAKNAAAKALKDAKQQVAAARAKVNSQAAQVTAHEQAVALAEGRLNANQFSGDGIYQVGVDVQPGTYYSGPPSSGNCYYAILSSPDTSDIDTNNNSEGPTILTVGAGKYLDVSGCDPFVKR